jgi:ferredoxin
VQQLHLRGVSPMPFSRFAGLEPRERLDDMGLDLANFLEDPCLGCAQPCVSICPVRAIDPDRDRVITIVSGRAAA